MEDGPKSGWQKTTADENNKNVCGFLKSDRKKKIREFALKLELSPTSAHEIVHDILEHRKLGARWVLKMLTDDQKLQRFEISQHLAAVPTRQCG